jgi:hypothetical protein
VYAELASEPVEISLLSDKFHETFDQEYKKLESD